jgi:predicted dehydrogenase
MFDDSGPIIIKYGNGREGQNDNVISTPSPYRFTVQFNEFSECVLSGKEPDFPPEDGMRNTRVIEALYQSSATGKIVEI